MQEQNSLLTGHEAPEAAPPTPVTCLGRTFPSDAARREHFTALLREKLQDPAFRAIEGFPHGTDEAILALSDPPYYCACPNPWIADFIAAWEAEKEPKPEGWAYHREPFAADVSEGKNDPIYNAHSYHTKVPHKAIMRYILHYTEPGDIVFDGFCGTGMTGVAAQLCGDRDAVLSLGYQVREDGTILREEEDENGKMQVRPFSKLGARKAVLNDLSPAATFIAYNYNTPVDVKAFEREAKRILKEVEDECGWMYETLDEDGISRRIDYVVWSELFSCPDCMGEVVFLEEAMDTETKRMVKEYPCPHCKTPLSKSSMNRILESYYDPFLMLQKERPKRKPVQIAYKVGKVKKYKTPDENDLEVLKKIQSIKIDSPVPINEYPYADMWEAPRMMTRGITHVHHLFLERQLYAVSYMIEKAKICRNDRIKNMLLYWLDQSVAGLSVLNRYQPIMHGNPGGSQVNRQMSGVYYVPSQIAECSPWYNLSGKMDRLIKTFTAFNQFNNCANLGTGSTTTLPYPDSFLDYIFIDPPFGDNFPYAELNFFVESWLGVLTDMQPEAVVERSKQNAATQKKLPEYRQLMAKCFKEAYRLLKPGRWMTVEFSNTKAAVWNTIQSALAEAGFIVANVAALDKQQGSFKAVTTPTAVKQDLVISAYKPNGGFEERFLAEAGTEEGVWDFVRTHMKYLPVVKPQGNALMPVPERDPRILYDQMLAYYVRKNRPIPLNSTDFQAGLAQRFPERDGMYFLPNQAAEYDKNKLVYTASGQLSLTVRDEATAIQWLRGLLKDKPQTFADINPQFMQQLSGWSKNEKALDLRELLTQNFLCYEPQAAISGTGKVTDGGRVPEQIHAYLSSNWKELRNLPKDAPELMQKAKDRWFVPDPNKTQDLEKMREKTLLKEFDAYLSQLGLKDGVEATVRKLKVFRMEAVRAGFKQAWQTGNYQTIVNVAEKIQTTILEEDPKLLMWYNMAETRLGGE